MTLPRGSRVCRSSHLRHSPRSSILSRPLQLSCLLRERTLASIGPERRANRSCLACSRFTRLSLIFYQIQCGSGKACLNTFRVIAGPDCALSPLVPCPRTLHPDGVSSPTADLSISMPCLGESNRSEERRVGKECRL